MLGPESSASPQAKLIHDWGWGFENRDLAHIAKYLHKDYRHTHYPRSLGLPEQTKEQWLEHFGGVLALMTGNEVRAALTTARTLFTAVKTHRRPFIPS